MSLKIISKTKIEDLAKSLIDTLYSNVENQDPFVEHQIIVPNKNIEKWLKLEITKNQGVCAGVKFPFFDNFLFNSLAELAETSKSYKPLSEAEIQIKIAKIILSDDSKHIKPLKDYVFGNSSVPDTEIKQTQTARKLWQLAGKLANYIREYEFRREEYINKFLSDDWEKEAISIIKDSNANKEALVLAQAYLCRKLFLQDEINNKSNSNSNEPEHISLRQILKLAENSHKPTSNKTLYFFGLSTFSWLHAKAIYLLAKHYDIQFYHINVCMEYWGDTETPWEKLKNVTEEQFLNNDSLSENELLNAWGSAGRETMKILVDLEESNKTEYFNDESFNCENHSVLEALQNSIKAGTSETDLEKRSQDKSIQILACPDEKREIETIYNSILDTVLSNQSRDKSSLINTLTPRTDISLSDFAILVPNMAKYRPIIETVFNSRGELPYGLLDSSASAESHYLRGVIELLTIAQFRYTRSSMVSLLSNPCVMKTWSYSDDDLAIWIEYINNLGIHHHYSKEGLTNDGFLAGEEYTWDYALSRLRLGLITIDESDSNSIPLYHTNNMYKERIEKLSALIETIYRATNPFKTEKHNVDAWTSLLNTATENILGSSDASIQAKVAAALAELSPTFDSPEEFYSAYILEYLKDKLTNISCNRGSFLTSGITIAALQPMRPIPFKYIYVVGLGEGEFPGNNQESTLDIRAIKRMLGDTSFASRNLYLFLETVMSAREKLILSYVAKDTKKDIDKYPSPVIKQLERFLNRFILEKEFEEFNVPLQEYLTPPQTDEAFCNLTTSYNNFIALGRNLSTSNSYKDTILKELASYPELQEKLSRSIYNIKPDFEKLIKDQANLNQSNEVFYWNESVLADFLKNARQAILKHRYNVASQNDEIDTTKDSAPINIKDEDDFIDSNQNQCLLNKAIELIKNNDNNILSNNIAEQIITSNYKNKQRESKAPTGIVGEYDLNILLPRILGNDYSKNPKKPVLHQTMAEALTHDLEEGKWISFHIGEAKHSRNDSTNNEEELHFSPLVYEYDINGINTSIVLNTSLDNVYKKGDKLVHICPYKHDGEKSLWLRDSMLRPLLSLIMYVAADTTINLKAICTLCIRAAIPSKGQNSFSVKSHYITLTREEAINYIYMLVSDLLSPNSLEHNYQYNLFKTPIKNALKDNIPTNNEEFVDIIETKGFDFINEYIKCLQDTDSNSNISHPPYGEEAIEEIFPTKIGIDENAIERILRIIMSRYYFPIVRQIIVTNN